MRWLRTTSKVAVNSISGASPMSRHQPRLMSLAAGSLMVAKPRFVLGLDAQTFPTLNAALGFLPNWSAIACQAPGHVEGPIYWNPSRNRCIGAVDLGFSPAGTRIRKKVSGKTKVVVRD